MTNINIDNAKEIFAMYLDPNFIGLERTKAALEKYQSKSILKSVKKILFSNDLITLTRKEKSSDLITEEFLRNNYWLIIGTRNQYTSTKFMYDNFSNIQYFHFTKPHTNNISLNIREMTNFNTSYTEYRLILRSLFVKFPYQLVTFFPLFYKNIYWFDYYLNVLQKYKPKGIIISNDHFPEYRAIVLAAKYLGIKTMYIQHACVTTNFPKLIVDIAFLDGDDAKNKYLSKGRTDTNIIKIGTPRLSTAPPKTIKYSFEKQVTIGLAFNTVDHIERVITLIQTISNKFKSAKIYVRPHPADTRDLSNLHSLQHGNIYYSNPLNDSANDFLKKIDILIAGDSSIHLEALYNNVVSFGHSFNDRPFEDYYDFVRNGLITVPDCILSALDKCLEKSQIKEKRKNAKTYISTINSQHEGQELDFAINQIRPHLS